MTKKIFLLLILSLLLANVSSFAGHSYDYDDYEHSHDELPIESDSEKHAKKHYFDHVMEHLSNVFIENNHSKTPYKVDKTKLLTYFLPQNEIHIPSFKIDASDFYNYDVSISWQNTYLTTRRLRI